MFDDLFYQIGQGEIFVKSGGMQHERMITDFFLSVLINLGFETHDPAQRVWKKQNRVAIVCLADDFFVCGANVGRSPHKWFNKDTVIITDNHITVPTEYQVCEFPVTYFGVYSYQPCNQNYQPQRRLHWSINRLDCQRLLIFLELVRQCKDVNSLLSNDYINYNAWDAQGINIDQQNVQNNFKKYFNQLNPSLVNCYMEYLESVGNLLPIRNHQESIEEINTKVWLCPVVETYSGNTTMAFSEKIFRALQTPVPWTLFGTTGAVAYLSSLGFDTLSDLVDHDYNAVSQDPPNGVEKITAFVTASIKTTEVLQGMDFGLVQKRCMQAAAHNQQLLATWRLKWPKDFADWLPQVIEKLI